MAPFFPIPKTCCNEHAGADIQADKYVVEQGFIGFDPVGRPVWYPEPAANICGVLFILKGVRA
jgi:hypothetical protein